MAKLEDSMAAEESEASWALRHDDACVQLSSLAIGPAAIENLVRHFFAASMAAEERKCSRSTSELF